MKFSLVHPSRGRVEKAEETAIEWAGKRSGVHTHEHILSIDVDDPMAPGYQDLAARRGLRVTMNRNRTMIDAANRGAAIADGDVIVAVSDDFGCPEAWDIALADVLSGRTRAAVLVHDGIAGRIMTLPVLTRAYFEERGHLYHPSYRSMYADDDLTEVARRDGVLVDARHLTFLHRHHSAGLSLEDETYKRQDSVVAWWHGWRVFEKRRLEDFGARERTAGVRLAQARVELYYRVCRVAAATRRRWLPLLGSSGRAYEARLRAKVLRLLCRALAVKRTDL